MSYECLLTRELRTIELLNVNSFRAAEISTFVITSLSSQNLCERAFFLDVERCSLDGSRDVTRVRHDAMAAWALRADELALVCL